MKRLCLAFALLLVAGCGGKGATNVASGVTEAPSAAATQSAETSAPAGETSPEPAGTPVAVPTATPDPNLLSTANGTILRSYSPPLLDHMNDGNLGNAAEGIGSEIPEDAKPPYVFTFELPGVTQIDSFEANLRNAPSASAPPGNVDIAVSTTGPDSGFKDVGTMAGDASGLKKTLAGGFQARWVRVTANQLFDSVAAHGAPATPPPNLNVAGVYIEQNVPDINGSFVMSGTRQDLSRVRFTVNGAGVTATECIDDRIRADYVGQLDGRTWSATFTGNKDANPDKVRAVVNDDASIVAGVNSYGSTIYFMRTTERPKWCVPRTTGTGAHHVLVLDQDPPEEFYPADSDKPLDGYAFDAIGAGMLDPSTLANHETVITRGVCRLGDLIGPQQMMLLLQWASTAGHKLILGGGWCTKGTDFTWVPYPFTAPESGPESINASLIQVENNGLGTNESSDAAHFVDTMAYVKNANNALAATYPVSTTDAHWCGHFFVAKTTNLNGFVQTYAVDGGGLLIYDGFNTSDNGNPQLQKIRQLELALPVPSDLPCTQIANEAFLLEPNQEATFNAGTAQTLHTTMDVLANQGWNGHVTLSTNGPYPATVTPAAFDIAGGVVHLDVAVNVPASAKAGVATIGIVANDGAGKTAQASYTLTGIAPIPKKATIAPHQRIRIYGIHFDYDSARIQPRSEPVIADIAALMRANPSWHFEVSGHTDSDGGAAYNLALSQRRAQSVVDDLVTRYGIARSRLVAKGYGLTRPVASNGNDAGKALNRRVELERLQ